MTRTSKKIRFSLIAVCALAFTAAACGDTWRGVKEDTRENVQGTGENIEDAGQYIKKQGQ